MNKDTISAFRINHWIWQFISDLQLQTELSWSTEIFTFRNDHDTERCFYGLYLILWFLFYPVTSFIPDANVIINHFHFASHSLHTSENWAVLFLWECFLFNSSRVNKSVSKLILSLCRLQKKAVGVLSIFVCRFLCLWAEPTVIGFRQQREQQAAFEAGCWGLGINTVTLFSGSILWVVRRCGTSCSFTGSE